MARKSKTTPVVAETPAIAAPTLASRGANCPECGKRMRFASSLVKFHFVNFPTHAPAETVAETPAPVATTPAAPAAAVIGKQVTFAATATSPARTVIFRTRAQKREVKALAAAARIRRVA